MMVDSRHRRTLRLCESLCAIGMELGGNAGARLAQRLAMPVSSSTLIRLVRKHPRPAPRHASAVGIDDWAICKRMRYGTILVDLDRHRPIGLLATRETSEVTQWLSQYVAPEVLTRDRTAGYRNAVSAAWPRTRHVADRWHLLKNLSETIERVIIANRGQVIAAVAAATANTLSPFERSRRRSSAEEARREHVLHRRHLRDRRIQQLGQSGLGTRAIARKLKLSPGTVIQARHTDLKASHAGMRRRRPSMLDPFVFQLQSLWDAGCRNAAHLYRTLRAAGYTGSAKPVRKWAALRRTEPAPTAKHRGLPDTSKSIQLPGARTLSWLLRTDHLDRLDALQRTTRDAIRGAMIFKQFFKLVDQFHAFVTTRDATRFSAWLSACAKSKLASVRHLAVGMRGDFEAIKNAIQTRHSNAQCEGQINRLKMLKRQMYGRAKVDLLEARLLWRSAFSLHPR